MPTPHVVALLGLIILWVLDLSRASKLWRPIKKNLSPLPNSTKIYMDRISFRFEGGFMAKKKFEKGPINKKYVK